MEIDNFIIDFLPYNENVSVVKLINDDIIGDPCVNDKLDSISKDIIQSKTKEEILDNFSKYISLLILTNGEYAEKGIHETFIFKGLDIFLKHFSNKDTIILINKSTVLHPCYNCNCFLIYISKHKELFDLVFVTREADLSFQLFQPQHIENRDYSWCFTQDQLSIINKYE